MSTASTKLQVVQVKALPPGTNAYEKQRAVILARLTVKVPSDLILPPSLIANPPNDVSSIPTTCGLLTDREIEITENYNAVDLARSIASKDLSAVEVTRAFAKRAIIAHQLTCCLTQLFMDEALERAKELDKYLEQHGKPIGPFHGVPISIKEHIPVAGTYSSQGSLASTVFNENDSHMVESTSHFGRTLNPFNIKLSAGGSTGGEAALVAMKGSVLGVGTDIGVSEVHERVDC
jgi:amidase